MTQLTDRSATELAALIRNRDLSAVEVIDAHLALIDRLNPTINAVVSVAPDAREQARRRDLVLARGGDIGPLHGVPFSAKDIIETADLPTTLGMRELADNRPERDATVVARMRAAGGILIGKTNCPAGGSGGETANELFGRTRNPYNHERSPGGSSGGEAAAIAGGMSACGLGSDSGGSLRMPAHFCGIATLKPTAGRIPMTGVLDEDGRLGPMSDPRTQPGPMARRADDLVLMTRVLAGPDGRDAGAMPIELGDADAVELRGLRVAVHVADGNGTPDAGTERALRAAADALAEAGAMVVDRSPPPGGHELTERVWESYGDEMSASQLYSVLRAWDAYRTRMLDFLEEVDLILSPVASHPAVLPGGLIYWRYTTPYSLTGWPCAVVRAGSSGNLPVGVQLVAGPWQDHVALAAAGCMEDALGGWQPPPARVTNGV
jgi:amidase